MKKLNKLVLLCFFFGLFVGCMTDRTAIMKVLTNPTSFDSVGRVYEHLHPCSNDTIIKGNDTSFVHDTMVQSFSFVDTVTNSKHDTTIIRLRTTATIHDTLEIRDNQILDDNVNLRSANSTLQVLNSSNNDLLKETTSTRDKWQFWAILLGCIAGLLCIALIFKSFRL